MSLKNDGTKSGAWGQPRVLLAGGLLAAVTLAYAPFWRGVFRLAGASDLYSHLPLIPAVSIYLVYIARQNAPRETRSAWGLAALLGGLGAAAMGAYWLGAGHAGGLPANDALIWPVLSWVLVVCAVVAGCVGWAWVRAYWFELLFLLFTVPMTTAATEASGVFLQYASANALDGLLHLTGQTYYRDGQVFHFPGLTLDVAIECSGIRSTLVLLITALLAGHLILRRRWKKIVLVLAVVPLGILRNAVRITTLALLTVHVDERIIDSPLHHRGGPIFFVLSLLVLFALVFALRAIGREKAVATTDAGSG